MIKLRPCPHHERNVRKIDGDNSWCGGCGALRTLSAWQLPQIMRSDDLRKRLIGEPHDLPATADRRAWEIIAAQMAPQAMQIAYAEGHRPPKIYEAARIIAEAMADEMVDGAWRPRFDPADDEAPAPVTHHAPEVST